MQSLTAKRKKLQPKHWQHKERSEAVKGNSSEEQALRESIAESSAIKILEIQRKYAEMSQKERETVSKSDLDLQKSVLLRNRLNRNYQVNKYCLINQRSRKNNSMKKRNIERNRLNKLLEIQLAYQSQRQSQDAEAYANDLGKQAEAYANGEITLETYLKRKKQITDDYNKQTTDQLDTQTGIDSITNQIRANDLKAHEDNEKAKTDATKRETDARNAIRQVELELAKTILNGFANLLMRDEKMRKEHGAAIKALQISELLVNSYGEISGYWKGYADEVATKELLQELRYCLLQSLKRY